MTAQTIRNWIESGTLPAARIGRAFRVRREDVDALLERARAENTGLATRRDHWAPDTWRLPQRQHDSDAPASIWDDAPAATLPPKAS